MFSEVILDAPTTAHVDTSHGAEKAWEQIPEDSRWYELEPPYAVPTDPFIGADGWPNLAGGPKHWKVAMQPATDRFGKLMRCFKAETLCALCVAPHGWEQHCCSASHFYKVHEITQQCREMACDELWQTVDVLGGSVKYNHLDGSIHGMRTPQEPQDSARIPQELLVPHQWVLIGAPACVPTDAASTKDHWPNLWSSRHWKDAMEKPSQKLIKVLTDNGLIYSANCKICPHIGLSEQHLLGPKHIAEIARLAASGEGSKVRLEDFWQEWRVGSVGAIVYNHVNGACRMCRRPVESDGKIEDVLQTPLVNGVQESFACPNKVSASRPNPTSIGDTSSVATNSTAVGAALAAALGKSWQGTQQSPPPSPESAKPSYTSQQPPPPPGRPPLASATNVPAPPPFPTAATESGALGSYQLPPASVSQTSFIAQQRRVPSDVTATVLPMGSSAPELTPEHTFAKSPLQTMPSLLLTRLWQQRVGPVASELEARLVRNGVPKAHQFCAICCRRGDQMHSESLAAHLTNDPGHLSHVEAVLEREGPGGPSWTQTWPGVVQIHHLNLELTVYEGSMNTDMGKDKDTWEEYSDPGSNKVWWYNTRTQEATWIDPHQR